MNGFLNVLKPPGMSSSDVVVALRRILREKRVGHTGTLDPGAAGVLAVAVGKATRAIEFAADEDKAYRCRLILGYVTDTDDMEGRVVHIHRGPLPDRHDLDAALGTYIGEIEQTPPAYSAVKVDGKRAYALAREGEEVILKPRRVIVHSIQVLRQAGDGQYDLLITCGKGVYIRSLCRDIGKRLGCGGTMGYLVRTRNGALGIEESLTLEEIRERTEGNTLSLIKMEETLAHLPALTWPERFMDQALAGRPLPLTEADGEKADDALYRMYCGSQFVGVGAVQASETGAVVRFRKMLAE